MQYNILKFKSFETSKEFENWQITNKHLKIEIISITPIAINSIGNTSQLEHDFGVFVIYRLIE
jgi:hypothetical protein